MRKGCHIVNLTMHGRLGKDDRMSPDEFSEVQRSLLHHAQAQTELLSLALH